MKTAPYFVSLPTVFSAKRTHKQRQGFSLIELLVSISIIAILASLAATGAMRVWEISKHARDSSNARQLTLALMTDATQHDGRFRTNADVSDTSLTGTTLEVFQGLINDGALDDPTVVMGEGGIKPKRSTLEDENIGFQYIAGYTTTSPSRLPLVVTRGVEIDPTDPEVEELDPGTSAWGYDGLIVAYIGGSTEWISGKEEGGVMVLNAPLGLGKAPPTATLYD